MVSPLTCEGKWLTSDPKLGSRPCAVKNRLQASGLRPTDQSRAPLDKVKVVEPVKALDGSNPVSQLRWQLYSICLWLLSLLPDQEHSCTLPQNRKALVMHSYLQLLHANMNTSDEIDEAVAASLRTVPEEKTRILYASLRGWSDTPYDTYYQCFCQAVRKCLEPSATLDARGLSVLAARALIELRKTFASHFQSGLFVEFVGEPTSQVRPIENAETCACIKCRLVAQGGPVAKDPWYIARFVSKYSLGSATVSKQ